MTSRTDQRQRRQRRVRKKVTGTPGCPRLSVFRSNRHISAQIIDDEAGRTVAAASSSETDLRSTATSNKEAASKVGQLLAERAKAAGVDILVSGTTVFKSNEGNIKKNIEILKNH